MELKTKQSRGKGWFIVDNKIVDIYGKYLGTIGLAIYINLCRRADNKTRKCFPSQIRIAKELGITDRTVRKYIQCLMNYNLIVCNREKKGGKWLNNVYTLIDKDFWLNPKEIVSFGNQRNGMHLLEEFDAIFNGKDIPIKDTNRKDTFIKKETKGESIPIKKENHIKNKKQEKVKEIKKEIGDMVKNFRIGGG